MNLSATHRSRVIHSEPNQSTVLFLQSFGSCLCLVEIGNSNSGSGSSCLRREQNASSVMYVPTVRTSHDTLQVRGMARSRKKKGGVVEVDEERIETAINKCLKRFRGSKEKQYLAYLLRLMLVNNAIPVELIELIPTSPAETGKTRFEQLYDAAMSVAFPGYRQETLERLLGPKVSVTESTKIWRVILPPKFKLAHVLIRAESYQEAFALGCDYACRASLRIHGKIPPDLTIRVMFVTEKAIRRKLDMRWANRVNKRRQLQLVGRVYSPKEIQGARLAAFGYPSHPHFQVARYLEMKDLGKIMKAKNIVRVSSVESEVFNEDSDNSD